MPSLIVIGSGHERLGALPARNGRPNGELYVAGRFAGESDFGGTTLGTPSCQAVRAFLARYDKAGALIWVRANDIDDSTHSIHAPNGVQVDPAGNVLVGVYAAGALYVAKYDSNGNQLWRSNPGNSESRYAGRFGIDSGGSSYLIGDFRESITFGTNTIFASPFGAFMTKFNPDGEVEWARTVATSIDAIYAVSLDAATNIFITGDLAQPALLGTNRLAPNSNSLSHSDVFLAKYNSAGENLWARKAGGYATDYGNGAATDRSGNCYIVGSFGGTATFGTNTIVGESLRNHGFLAKYDPAGNALWVRPGAGTNYALAFDVVVDPEGGVFFGGDVVAKYNADGDLRWTTERMTISALALQGGSNLFAVGVFGGTLDFGSFILKEDGLGDGYVAKLTGVDLLSQPTITNRPIDSASSPGSGLTLSVQAAGGGRMSYQWRINGVDIPGATNAALQLPGISLDGAGLYSVVARNELGATTNLAANITLWSLQVTGAVAQFEIAGPLNAEYTIEYTDSLGSNWRPLTNVTLLDGVATSTSGTNTAPARFYRLKKLSP